MERELGFRTLSYAGTNRVRFQGYALSPAARDTPSCFPAYSSGAPRSKRRAPRAEPGYFFGGNLLIRRRTAFSTLAGLASVLAMTVFAQPRQSMRPDFGSVKVRVSMPSL